MAQERHVFGVTMSTIGKVFVVADLCVTTPSVLLLLRVVLKMLPEISTHAGLFIAVYFGFAGMGMSFYCGKLTQTMTEGGPGDWCTGYPGAQDWSDPNGAIYLNGNCTISKGTGIPWSDTAYASGTYYWKYFNFNGYLNAFMNLWVVMIQNNWTTAVNGPVEVTSTMHRLFFFIFVIVVAFVMMNILVGAIVDQLSANRDELLAEVIFRSVYESQLRKRSLIPFQLYSTELPGSDSDLIVFLLF